MRWSSSSPDGGRFAQEPRAPTDRQQTPAVIRGGRQVALQLRNRAAQPVEARPSRILRMQFELLRRVAVGRFDKRSRVTGALQRSTAGPPRDSETRSRAKSPQTPSPARPSRRTSACHPRGACHPPHHRPDCSTPANTAAARSRSKWPGAACKHERLARAAGRNPPPRSLAAGPNRRSGSLLFDLFRRMPRRTFARQLAHSDCRRLQIRKHERRPQHAFDRRSWKKGSVPAAANVGMLRLSACARSQYGV